MLFPILKAGSPPAETRLQAVRDRLASMAKGAGRAKTRALSPEETVRLIVDDVRHRKDRALFAWARKLDRFRVNARNLRVSAAEIRQAHNRCDPALLAAIRTAAANVRAYQKRLLPPRVSMKERGGIRTGARYVPLARVGVYVPGVPAAFPSSVIMNALPAVVAGVEEVAIATPPDAEGRVADGVLAAAREIGVDEIYRLGGAQAVAALAFGTESVPRVDKVVGPGNLFVMLAKRAVFGACDVDGFYGPSEVVIIADAGADAEHVAADLLAQAEHDPLASAVLVTPSAPLAGRVRAALVRRLAQLPRARIAKASLSRYGFAIVVKSLKDAVRFANEFAPEHLEILTRKAQTLLPGIKNAGAVFLGDATPEVLGDYIAGPSHSLPTGGTARFMSGLAAPMFLKRISVIQSTPRALEKNLKHLTAFARAEELEAHALSAEERGEKGEGRRERRGARKKK